MQGHPGLLEAAFERHPMLPLLGREGEAETVRSALAVELALGMAAAPRGEEEKSATERASEPSPQTEPPHPDLLSRQVALVQRSFRLSARETEVMELIARGYTVARIAEMLVVSENTIRTHSKRIYAKLDVHKRQELRDLIDSFDPRELG